MDRRDIDATLPLTPKVLHILMALAAEPMNGYQLGLRVEETSRGTIRMSPGTLYENVHRLAERGLIGDAGDAGPSDGRGQRYYTLTAMGLEVLKAEVARLAADLSLARSLPALGT
ncbi:MAG TPA: PadR family transcriptional regulator [Longimicrobiales bacterium]|jgi:DNA-binding PadR family transcriptional regulator